MARVSSSLAAPHVVHHRLNRFTRNPIAHFVPVADREILWEILWLSRQSAYDCGRFRIGEQKTTTPVFLRIVARYGSLRAGSRLPRMRFTMCVSQLSRLFTTIDGLSDGSGAARLPDMRLIRIRNR